MVAPATAMVTDSYDDVVYYCCILECIFCCQRGCAGRGCAPPPEPWSSPSLVGVSLLGVALPYRSIEQRGTGRGGRGGGCVWMMVGVF